MITNISGYQFRPVTDLCTLKKELLAFCQSEQLKGTLLLATEGINIMMAGEASAIKAFEQFMETKTPFKGLTFKYSYTDHYPFKKCLVKIKQEIVTMGVAELDLSLATDSHLSPQQLKAWLDEGEDLLLIDTRNDYEIALGTFEKAMDLNIHHFREFPAKIRALDPSLKEKKVVVFCTGGIRCEKAAPYMVSEGFKDVYQLEGGILDYFKTCQGEHYKGDCFVFDERVTIDKQQEATGDSICPLCQVVLRADLQASHQH